MENKIDKRITWVATIQAAVLALVLFAGMATAQATSEAPRSDALQSLLEVLKDDAARTALIEELENTSDVVAEQAPVPDEVVISFGRRIATFTQELGENAVASATAFWEQIRSGDTVYAGLRGNELSILLDALWGLFAVIAITVTLFLGLRSLAGRFYRRIDLRAQTARGMERFGLFMGSNLLDALIVVLAWAAGYIVTLLAVGQFGTIGIRQTMYLNAFLIVELSKTITRTLLSPTQANLRPIPVSNYAARALTKIFGIVFTIVGYGHLLIVPIVNQSAGRAAGTAVSAILSLLVLIYLFSVVLRRREMVAAWLRTVAHAHGNAERAKDDAVADLFETDVDRAEPKQGLLQRSLLTLAGAWHWFALIYLAAMFFVVSTQSAEVTFHALFGSVQILTAIMVAALVSAWLADKMSKGIVLPQHVNDRLPLLEARLNLFVPRALGFLRLVMLLLVAIFSLDVIGIYEMGSWLTSPAGRAFSTKAVAVLLILLVSFSLWLALTSFVDYRLNPDFGSQPTARETTLLTLMRNALTIVLLVMTLMFVLSEIGLNIGPLLASAGVLGLAIGFGAQKMVQDIITGVFIQLENSINVGDVITLTGITGTVERLSVRSVSLRDVQGTVHIIPFSSVDMVSNFMKDFSYFVCDMGIAYREDVDEAKDAMHDAFDKMLEEKSIAQDVRGPLEWFGVNSFGDNAVVLRARIKTAPGKQWGTGRAYNWHLKKIFDERGIEIPFPQRTIWLGEAKDGSTQPIRMDADSNKA